MRIGVPREIKNHEHRVSITPEGVAALVAAGHQVVVQSSSGEDSGFPDRDYLDAGAVIAESAEQAWRCELVVKVKEPLASEYRFLRPELVLFTFLHLAAVPELAKELLAKRVCAIGYETVQDDHGLPILAQMSRVAGRVAVQLGVRFLQRENGTPFSGKGKLAGGIEGVAAACVMILGAGNVGMHAASAAAGLGADVILLESNEQRIAALQASTADNIDVRHFSADALRGLLPACDILIGAALIPGKHAPELLTRADLRQMQAGSVFIDVSIDQGGISETSRPTTYDEPVYLEEGVIHCCLPNLPGSVPLTSTLALTQASFPYIRLIADHGVEEAVSMNSALAWGVNTRDGHVKHPAVADSLGFADLRG